MIVCVNLIPESRQQLRKRKNRTYRWIIGLTIYGLFLLLGCGMIQVFAGQDDAVIVSQVASNQARLDTIRSSIVNLKNTLIKHELTLLANRELIEHPDWGLLLGLLAEVLTDGLVLRGCEIQQQTTSSSSSDDSELRDREVTFQLVVTGRGRSQAEVSQLTLRLEETGLFDSVKLVDTNLEPYLSSKAVAFSLECQLGEGGP